MKLKELGTHRRVYCHVRFLCTLDRSVHAVSAIRDVLHTLRNVSAVSNWPVRRKWRAMVLSNAAVASGDENSG